MPLTRQKIVLSIAVVVLLVLAMAGFRIVVHPGLHASTQHASVPADGAEHLIATIRARHHLPLCASQLHLSGLPSSGLRLEDAAGGAVNLYLRAPLFPGRLRISISGRGGNLSIPITFLPSVADTFADGTPDFIRLHSADDRVAFRRWFVALVDHAADVTPAQLPPEITDCASLLRYAYRESLRQHDNRWFAQFPDDQPIHLSSVQQWTYPDTPLGLSLFRTRPGRFAVSDIIDGTFAQFADAKTLIAANTFFVSRDLSAARPGDLIFFRLLETDSQYHSMVITSPSEWVVYHTGPIDHRPGEMRRVLLSDLLQHPDPRWRPTPSNPNFLGVYRWNILRED